MTDRADAKRDTRRRLLTAAREILAEQGAAALSLRDVARRAGVVPSAVYRHMASRDELLTELLVSSYTSLAEALEALGPTDWTRAADALRSWAGDRPHEFQLLYGTPVPGYAAPERTVHHAARIAAVFLAARTSSPGSRVIPAETTDALTQQLTTPADEFGTTPAVLADVLADLAQLVGLLLLEASGHFVGTADPADHLWETVVRRQSTAETHRARAREDAPQ